MAPNHERFSLDPSPATNKSWFGFSSAWYSSKKWIVWHVFLAAVISALVIAVIVLAVDRNRLKSNESVQTSEDICSDSSCIESARYILSGLNETVDPCEDFYNFTCGRWKSNNLPLDEDDSLSEYGVLQEKIDRELNHMFRMIDIKDESIPRPVRIASMLYKTCPNKPSSFDKEKLESILVKLDPIGGWPILNPSNWTATDSWINMSIKAMKAFGGAGVISIDVGENAYNTSQNIIMITKPESVTAKTLFDENIMGSFLDQLEISNNTYAESLLKVGNLFYILEQIEPPPLTDSQAFMEKDNYMTIRNLTNEIPSVDWLSVINSIAEEDPLNPTLNITMDEQIFVNNLTYFKKVIAYLENETIETSTLANYIGWDVMVSWLDPVITLLEFFHVRVKSADMSRVSQCARLIRHLFNYAVDFAYAEYINKENMKKLKKAKEMIQHLKKSFGNLAHQADWLDQETLKHVDVKLEAMKIFNDVHQWLYNKTKLDKFYEGLNVTGDFEEDFLSIIKYFSRRDFKRLRNINGEKDWFIFVSSAEANAYYMPSQNIIMFPVAIQNLPFYGESRPWYLNFGAIGSVVGHEITHGFDNLGSQRDGNGNVNNWWSANAKNNFEEKIKCFEHQYSNYSVEMTGSKIDGTKTLSENIADSGGLRQSYDAYKKWEVINGIEPSIPGLEKYSRDQLFFISYASIWCSNSGESAMRSSLKDDSHSPSHFRVNSALSNFDKFSETFQCKPSSKMNPKEKCIIW